MKLINRKTAYSFFSLSFLIVGIFFFGRGTPTYASYVSPWISATPHLYGSAFMAGGQQFHVGAGDSPFDLNANGCPVAGTYTMDWYQGDNGIVYSSSVEATVASVADTHDIYNCSGGAVIITDFSITTPEDMSTLNDFNQWQIHTNNLTGLSGNYSIEVFYSDDETKLTDCLDFPYSSGYTECFYSTTRIYYDQSPTFSAGVFSIENTFKINKNENLTIGKTYYAVALLRTPDIYGASNIYTSTEISFTIGIPTTAPPTPESCATFDLACYIKQALAWAFIPTQESLQQFSTLTLENSLPFSYGYDIGNIYNEMFPTSGSSLSLSLSTAMGTWTLLDGSTTSQYTWYSIAYGSMSALMYISTAFFIYKKIIGIHDTGHTTV